MKHTENVINGIIINIIYNNDICCVNTQPQKWGFRHKLAFRKSRLKKFKINCDVYCMGILKMLHKEIITFSVSEIVVQK